MNKMIFMFILLIFRTPFVMLQMGYYHYRIMYGMEDRTGNYPFIVALVSSDVRSCSGTLLSPHWVLTVRHCLQDCMTHVQYGDMSKPPNMSDEKSIIVKMVPQPGFRSGISSDLGVLNDIGLCRVEPILIETFGRLSSVDYKSLIGLPVEYAGYHETKYPYLEDQQVQIAHGLISFCEKTETSGPFLCVVPKRSNKFASSGAGECGGPMLVDGKVAGVISFSKEIKAIEYVTAASPFIMWIHNVIFPNTNSLNASEFPDLT